MLAHATATDTLGAVSSVNQTLTAGTKTGMRTLRRSFYGARMNWSSVVDESIWGPTLNAPDDFGQIMTGPITVGNTLTMMRDCRIIGVRLYKSPTAVGSIPVGMWDAVGNLLTSKTLSWVVDEGGYREVLWDAPVPVKDGQEYNWGYFYPNADTNYAGAIWVWNGQDYTNYPFWQKGFFVTGAGVRSHAGWRKPGGTGLTFSSLSADRAPCDYYIDPIAEWTDDTPGYDGGTSYFAQWDNSTWFQTHFPITVFWPDLGDYHLYRDVGVNIITTGDSATQNNIDQFKAEEASVPGGLKWIPSLYSDDMSGPIATGDDPVLASIIVGYFVMDEAELNQNPWFPPETTLAWYSHARQYDSTRINWQNLSKMTADNQGFIFAPAGVDMVTKELNIRRYGTQTDIASLDKYSLAGPESYAQNVPYGGANRYGLWTYPLCIKRIREVTDGRNPVWAIIETTSEFPNQPTPSAMDRAVWSMLIAGARGLELFDHRFRDSDVEQDFGALLRVPAMKTQVTSMCALIQTLKNALFAPDAGLIESYTSSGNLAFAQGGYAIGAKIPMHFTTRIADGKTYIFAQVIRDGATTAVFHAPSLAGATLTVIGESRTVTVDGTGHFTDNFAANYQYHLYSTTTAPTYVTPANVVPPLLYSDGVPQPGDTLTCSYGGWTGSCLTPTEYYLPQYEYQWQKDGTNIVGAVSGSYVVQGPDQGHAIRCVIRATNPAGTATANSNALTIVAPDAPPVNTVAPVITTDGTPQTGETVSCSLGTWSSVLTLSYAYQWQSDGANLVGETGATHLLTLAEQGHVVRCVVTATNTAGSTSANSNTITPAAPNPPTNSVAPAISGSTAVGSLLTCAAGTWTGGPTFTFKWQANSGSGFTDISGATSSTYSIVTGDEGKLLRCVVTATNTAGSASANSNSLSVPSASSAYFAAVIADSPLGYWRLGESATPWLDSSGNGHHMTEIGSGHAPTSAASLVPSTSNPSSLFDGFGAIGVASDSNLESGTGVTLEIWVKQGAIYTTAPMGKGWNAIVMFADGSVQFSAEIAGGTLVYQNTGPGVISTTPGSVYHMVMTYNGTTIKGYVNGVEVMSYTEAHIFSPSTSRVRISGDDHGTATVTGSLDEAAFYGIALSAVRIAKHYLAGIGSDYPATVLADSPIGYWRLNDLADSSGHALTLTTTGSPTFVSSLLGSDPGSNKARHLDGSSYFTHPHDAVFSLTNRASIEAWVTPDVGGSFVLASKGFLQLRTSGGKFQFIIRLGGGGDNWVDATAAYTVGQTYHVVGTYDGNDIKLYINGVLNATNHWVDTLGNDTDPFRVGMGPSGATPWVGAIDEVAIYSTTLSASRVLMHYAAGLA